MSENAEYLSCADTAKLVRVALKKAFPGQKFSVTSSTYSMGASISIHWTDGPLTADVEKVTDLFSGAGFDGSIDLKYDREHWIMPNGEVRVAEVYGTRGSLGQVPSYKTGAEFGEITGARRVSFGADYVFCQRKLSDEYRARLEARLAEITGKAYDGNARYSVAIDGRCFDDWGSQIVWQMSNVSEATTVVGLAS